MEFIFTREMQADLMEVDNSFEKSLLPWWEDISVYVPKAQEELSFQVLPALVINAYGYLGLERELAIQMANIFKTIYFASKIHVLIGDDQEGQPHNQDLQFSILIGDYIFGRVLKLLLETHTDQLLHMFGSMICQINEGLIVKYKLEASLEEVLVQTRAPFYHYAFLSAAKMAGMAPIHAEIYGQIGQNVGMALELLFIEGEKSQECVYLDRAEQLLGGIPAEQLPGRQGLIKLIRLVGKEMGGSGNGL
jgi:geranylgeranyl pyrophosphate synthase